MATEMTEASLAYLADDILCLIGEYLSCPQHIRALVLTSRRFSHLFINHLYRLGSKLPDYRGGALGWAACQDNLSVAQRAIAAGVNLDIIFKPHIDFLQRADARWLCESETQEIRLPLAPLLIRTTYKDEATPLVLAVRHGSMAMAQLLIDAGADVNLEPCRGRAPIAIAIEKKSLPMVQLLGETGRVDWDAPHEHQWRALGMAAKANSPEIVDALALTLSFKHQKIVDMLLAHPEMAPTQYLLGNPLRAALTSDDMWLLKLILAHGGGKVSLQALRQMIKIATNSKRNATAEFLKNHIKEQFPESEPVMQPRGEEGGQ